MRFDVGMLHFQQKSRMNGYKQILESFCIITNKMWTRSSTMLYEKRVACGKFITQFYGMHGDCKRDFAFTLHVFQRYRKIASLKSKGLDKCFFCLENNDTWGCIYIGCISFIQMAIA